MKEISRRSFLQILTGGLVAIPAALLGVERAFAADLKALPKGKKALDENAPMARALGYKHDAAKVDTKRYKKYVPGENCLNCVQYVPAKGTAKWGECKIIKGGLVADSGWCNSYLAKK